MLLLYVCVYIWERWEWEGERILRVELCIHNLSQHNSGYTLLFKVFLWQIAPIHLKIFKVAEFTQKSYYIILIFLYASNDFVHKSSSLPPLPCSINLPESWWKWEHLSASFCSLVCWLYKWKVVYFKANSVFHFNNLKNPASTAIPCIYLPWENYT